MNCVAHGLSKAISAPTSDIFINVTLCAFMTIAGRLPVAKCMMAEANFDVCKKLAKRQPIARIRSLASPKVVSSSTKRLRVAIRV